MWHTTERNDWPVWTSRWLVAAGIYNLLWGGLTIAWPHLVFDLAGMGRMSFIAVLPTKNCFQPETPHVPVKRVKLSRASNHPHAFAVPPRQSTFKRFRISVACADLHGLTADGPFVS